MRRWIIAFVLGLGLFVPVPALGCWDGFSARVRNVDMMGGDEGSSWTPELARELATWLGRIDALLPRDGSVSVRIEWSEVTLESADGEATLRWNQRSFPALFDRIATALRIGARARARARATLVPVSTVQVASYLQRNQAEAVARRLSDHQRCEHGFLEVGGMPADNPRAHVLEETGADGRRLYRVVVGAFIDPGEAGRVRDAIVHGAFVRWL